MAFLRRYGISEGSVRRITDAIVMMMRREGEFASMNEREAQAYLQKMLVEAGAKLSAGPQASQAALGRKPTAPEKTQPDLAGRNKKAEKEKKRKDRKRTF
jgi:hypothetical protein